jgi:hypothetical protein
MVFDTKQEKQILAALLVVFVVLAAYRMLTGEEPKTAPLTYARGSVALSTVRPGAEARAAGGDLLGVFSDRRRGALPAVSRDIFRMENPAPRAKPKPAPVTIVTPTAPPVPVKTPEETAKDLARADLSKFRFLGYLTDGDNTLFLSKDGENFIVKNGDTVLKTYRIKDAGKDYVILLDAATGVDMRIELSGSGPK